MYMDYKADISTALDINSVIGESLFFIVYS